MDPHANIIFGALVDESMNGEIAITVIATGFPVGTTAISSPGIVANDCIDEQTKPALNIIVIACVIQA